MGIYLNPQNEVFRRITSAEIYVDKSMMLAETNKMLNSVNSYICISRPRRFGKTTTGNMLCAYYSKGCDSRKIFDRLKISSDSNYEKHLNKYNVIYIDMNSEYQNSEIKEQMLEELKSEIKAEIVNEYSDIGISDSQSLAKSLQLVYQKTGDTFIIIIDEYDVLVREQVSKTMFNEYLNFLNGLFKSNTLRPAISLAYITGILPVVRDKVQSKLNNFREYTILNSGKLAEYVGFTDKDVRNLCNKYDMNYDECRKWYDGYYQHGIEIYNPESVVRSMEEKCFDSYWSITSTYQVVSDYIGQNFDGTKDAVIRMLGGEAVDVEVTGFLNTMDSFVNKDQIFTYLIHTGYLAYDISTHTCRIPNLEIRKEWQLAVADLPEYSETDKIIKASKLLLEDTLDGNEEAVAKALDISHIHVTSNRSYNNEDALQSAIYLAYIYALNDYTVVREMTAGKGFADVVYIPLDKSKTALIIELKRNDCAESAIDQIRDKCYFDSLSHYEGNLLFVGINYDEKDKTHTCKIERFKKISI